MIPNEKIKELAYLIGKEQLAEAIRNYIRGSVPEPLACCYCRPFNNAKNMADNMELIAKLLRYGCI